MSPHRRDLVSRLVAWGVAALVVFGAFKAVASWQNPWSAAAVMPASFSASAVHIPGCAEKGCGK